MRLLRKTCGLAILAVLVASIAPAQTRMAPRSFDRIELEGGRVIQNARVISQTPLDVMFMHSGGVDNIKFEDLPDPIRKALGYDPEKALKAVQDRLKDARERRAIEERNRANLQRKLALLNQKAAPEKETPADPNIRTLVGRVISVTNTGLIVECADPARRIVRSSSSSVGGGGRTYAPPVSKYRYKREYGSFHITSHPDIRQIADGDRIEIEAHRTGTFSYTAVDGSRRTVPEYRYRQKANPVE